MSVEEIYSAEVRTRWPNLPDWRTVLGAERSKWSLALEAARAGGPKILMATSAGGGSSSATSAFESLLAVALTLRGAEVHVLLCNQELPACMNLEHLLYPNPTGVAARRFRETADCSNCAATGQALFSQLGLPVHHFRDFLGARHARELQLREALMPSGRLVAGWGRGRSLRESAAAGMMRYLARGEVGETSEDLAVLDAFHEAALCADAAMRGCLAELHPRACVSSHGLYVPYGVINSACRDAGVRYAAWNVAYRRQCFIFSHGDTYHHTLLEEPTETWEKMPWTPERESVVEDYLRSRLAGRDDWIWFFEHPNEDVEGTLARLGVPASKPRVVLLTNVIWDAQLHYRANAYQSMMDWLLDTIEWFRRRPEIELLVRVHPAELRPTLPSRQRVVDELARLVPVLPPNVRVIGPEEQLSTYALADACDAALIYGTKTGVELACRGIPVIVAGEAWVRGKGITHDADSRDSYHAWLARLPFGRRLPEEVRRRALRYAYHFFFRRMIPVAAARPTSGGWPPFNVVPATLDALAPGADPGLDVICSGILEGRDFVFDRA